MVDFYTPNLLLGRQIEHAARCATPMCWTCGSCDLECPVNIATGRLKPQKIVRMANLGFIDELMHLPEIWYCQTCRRCANVCPNAVHPSTLISYIRYKILEAGLISVDKHQEYQNLFTAFQRVRWHAINACLHNRFDTIGQETWNRWITQPIPVMTTVIRPQERRPTYVSLSSIDTATRTRSCFTCGECSSACPIICDGSVFDPRMLFRMVNLGMFDELMATPSIWMCLSCGRCTEACSQLVDGCLIIDQMKELAIQNKIVGPNFFICLEQANKTIYDVFLDHVDALMQ